MITRDFETVQNTYLERFSYYSIEKKTMARSPEGLKPTSRLFASVRRGQRLGSHSRIIWLSRAEFDIFFIQIAHQLSSRCWVNTEKWSPPVGFEPTTSCTTDGCTNQLHHFFLNLILPYAGFILYTFSFYPFS